ncbi:MAG: histidine--tRNA ligase, partial [Chloroflexi bacterium]|nr:histidine--tRNA ligase [Chloroflexota bacterium]
MRLLDCKDERCQPIIAGAPAIGDHLCDACDAHFGTLRGYLDSLGIDYQLAPRLVRGLDYYTRTVFEFQPRDEGSQSAVGGGGRYDGLIELLGGRPTPGIGFGSGIERIILNMKRQDVPLPSASQLNVFVVCASAAARVSAFKLASGLRRAGLSAIVGDSGRSMKAQMRHASSLDAAFAAIIGDRELESASVTLKRLADGSQETVPIGDIVARVQA